MLRIFIGILAGAVLLFILLISGMLSPIIPVARVQAVPATQPSAVVNINQAPPARAQIPGQQIDISQSSPVVVFQQAEQKTVRAPKVKTNVVLDGEVNFLGKDGRSVSAEGRVAEVRITGANYPAWYSSPERRIMEDQLHGRAVHQSACITILLPNGKWFSGPACNIEVGAKALIKAKKQIESDRKMLASLELQGLEPSFLISAATGMQVLYWEVPNSQRWYLKIGENVLISPKELVIRPSPDARLSGESEDGGGEVLEPKVPAPPPPAEPVPQAMPPMRGVPRLGVPQQNGPVRPDCDDRYNPNFIR